MLQTLANVFVWFCILSIALLIIVGVRGYHELSASQQNRTPDEQDDTHIDFDGVSKLDLLFSTRAAMRYDRAAKRSRSLRFVGRSM